MGFIKVIEKYIWIINLLLLAVVAYLLAGFTNFQLSKKYVLAQAVSVKKQAPTFVSSGFSYHPTAEKIIEGNVFGTIPVTQLNGATAEAQQVTNVDADLLGVIYFSLGNKLNQATIKLKQDNKTDVYKIGDELSPGVKIQDIFPQSVILSFGNGHTQELVFNFGIKPLPGMEEAAGGYVDPYSRMSPAERNAKLGAYRKGLVDDNIQQIGENNYKIQKVAIEKAMSNLNEVITQARMVPNFVQDGQGKRVDGFRVFKIIPGSIFEKLGIRDGDVIKKINNAPLDSVDQAFMLLQSLRYEKKFDIDVLRGNQPVTMTYQVVE